MLDTFLAHNQSKLLTWPSLPNVVGPLALTNIITLSKGISEMTDMPLLNSENSTWFKTLVSKVWVYSTHETNPELISKILSKSTVKLSMSPWLNYSVYAIYWQHFTQIIWSSIYHILQPDTLSILAIMRQKKKKNR